MTDTASTTNGNGDIAERVEKLEGELSSFRARATVPGADVIYRPPLWSQESAYSAADDRRLIHAALWPGVVDPADLEVRPRQEGANLSVDVMPGEVIVPGTEQVDQGHYVCALTQRVNVPIAAGPSAGNYRHTWIIARVYEPVGEEAYWQIETFNSNPAPENVFPPTFPPSPSSYVLLADVFRITQSTAQVTAPMIYDYRRLSRPAATGSSFVAATLNPILDAGFGFQVWNQIHVRRPPLGLPLDLEIRMEGMIVRTAAPNSLGEFQCGAFAGPEGDNLTSLNVPGHIGVATVRVNEFTPISWSLFVPGVIFRWPDQLWAQAIVRTAPGNFGVRYQGGQTLLRVSPSASRFLGPTGAE